MYIREFSWPGDYGAIIKLWQAAGLHNPSVDGLADLREAAQRNPGLFLVAVDPEFGIVGSVIGAFDGRRAYLYHVAVHPDFRREGYGTELIREVEKRIWALGARKLRFMVHKDNLSAQAFYRTLGFELDSFAVSMSKVRPEEPPRQRT
jgi:ribosomal protein S18 acetylase RimI-like enzyme